MDKMDENTAKNREWKIVSRDGNPKVEGIYNVVLLFPRNTDDKDSEKAAILTTRYFGDAADYKSWVMKDQPDTGLVWTEESGSYLNESVYAWMEMEDLTFPELPEGVIPYDV